MPDTGGVLYPCEGLWEDYGANALRRPLLSLAIYIVRNGEYAPLRTQGVNGETSIVLYLAFSPSFLPILQWLTADKSATVAYLI